MDIREMLQERFQPKTKADYVVAIKTLIQEMVLIGLGRAKFFEHAAFYGGTALRIIYQLPRFSEDLDFTLLAPSKEFSLKPYFQAIKTELTAFGFEIEITEASKQTETQIESAFIKANTRLHLFQIGVPDTLIKSSSNEIIKVKFEVDTNPPHEFDTEVKYLLVPIPFSVKVVNLEQMFAGKIHALLCRNWKTRVKGRDWYDLVWFVGRKVACPVACVESRMRQSGHWAKPEKPDAETMKQMLLDLIKRVDLKAAKNEAMLFVDNQEELNIWSKEFFEHCVNEIIWL